MPPSAEPNNSIETFSPLLRAAVETAIPSLEEVNAPIALHLPRRLESLY